MCLSFQMSLGMEDFECQPLTNRDARPARDAHRESSNSNLVCPIIPSFDMVAHPHRLSGAA